MASERHLHTSHWGAFEAEVVDGSVVAVHPHPEDPDPSPLLDNIPASLRHRARIARPMVRAGWFDRGPGPDGRRGAEPFVPVSWATAIDLLARELRRVYDVHGGEAIYGGSYGWASVLTFDRGTSKLAQACSGQHALVEVERWTGPVPPIRAYDPPPTERRPGL